MSEHTNKGEGGVTGKTDRCSVCERVLGENDGSPKMDFEHSLHHSTECKSAVTGGARGIKIPNLHQDLESAVGKEVGM